MKRFSSENILQTNKKIDFKNVSNIDICLFRFKELNILQGDDVGINLTGPQIEMIHISHYIVGNCFFITQRMREKEKSDKHSSEYYNKKPSLVINLTLPKDFTGDIKSILCNGEVNNINVVNANLALTIVTSTANIKNIGNLYIESGDSSVNISNINSPVCDIKSINSLVTLNSGNINELNIYVEELDNLESKVVINNDVIINNKENNIHLENNSGKIEYKGKIITNSNEFLQINN